MNRNDEIGMIHKSASPFYMADGFLHFIGNSEKVKPRNFCEPEKSHVEYQEIINSKSCHLSAKTNHKGKEDE